MPAQRTSMESNYAAMNTYYDKNWKENRIKCRNHLLCNSSLQKNHHARRKNYLCYICYHDPKSKGQNLGYGWNELNFFQDTEACPCCLESDTWKVYFPTNCGHSFCVKCSRELLFWDETRFQLSPEPYGAPSCPNHCNNPNVGRQCVCEEYDAIKHEWALKNQHDYWMWQSDEYTSIFESKHDDGHANGTRKCPICRQVYMP